MHYDWLRKYPKYAAAFERARQDVAGLLEDEAVRRAYRGTMKPTNVGGKLVMVHEFSDQLLMFLMKNRNPKVFGEKNTTAHRFVDGEGKDRTLNLDAVRAYMQQAPEAGEPG